MNFEFIRIKDTTTGWDDKNANIRNYGEVPGYMIGFNVEVVNDKGELDYMSSRYLYGDIEEALNEEKEAWGYIYGEDTCNYKGYYITGRLVFRGYFTEEYDWEEREEYIIDASDEVESFMSKYMI